MTVSTHRRALLQGVAGVAAGLAAPAVVRAQNREYKLSVVGNRPLGTAVAAYRWTDLVRERTQGRVDIKVYPAAQLVGGETAREFVAMRQGVIDFLVSSTINLSPQIREMNLFSLPFLMPDSAAFDAVTTGEVRRNLDAVLAARDTVSLAWSENGFRQVSNSKRAVRKPDDMKGLKIRFAAGPIYADIFNALGANPLQMSWADLQPALATGAVDGQETPVNVFLQSRLDVSQRHVSIWNYVADANIFHVGIAAWNGFSPADRDIVRAAAEQAAAEHTADTRKGLGGDGDRSSLDELVRRKVELVELTAAEKQVFGAATKPVFDKWAAQVGADLVRKAEAAIARKA